MLRVLEVVDAAPVLVGTDGLVFAVAVEIDGVVADVVVHAIHDEVHAAFLHFFGELLQVIKVAEERVDRAVVTRIVAMVGGGAVNRVDVDSRHAEALQIVELLRDAGEVAAVEVVAVPFIAIGGVRGVRGRRSPAAVLYRLRAAGRRARVVVLLVAVKETVREDLIADGFLRPLRRRVALLVARNLEIFRAAELQLARAASLGVVAVFLRVIQEEFVAVDTVGLRGDRGLPEVRAALRGDFLHRDERRRAAVVVRVVLVAALGGHGRFREDDFRILHVAGLRLQFQRDGRALSDGAPRAAHVLVPAVVLHLIGVDAAIVGDEALGLLVIVERDVAAARDVHGLRKSGLALLRNRSRVVARVHRAIRLEQVREHEVIHGAVFDARHAADDRQFVVRQHFVAVAVGNLMRLVVIVEGDGLRLVERHGDIRAVGEAVQAVVLGPAAVDGDFVVIGAGRHVLDGEFIEAVTDVLHLRRHVRRSPFRARAAEGLQVAAQHDVALVRERSLLGVFAGVVHRDFMGFLVVGERDFVVSEQAQRDVAAVRLAVFAVVHVPGAAEGDFVVVVALGQFADEDAMAFAVGFHEGLRVGGVPLFARTEFILQGTDENHVRRLEGAS